MRKRIIKIIIYCFGIPIVLFFSYLTLVCFVRAYFLIRNKDGFSIDVDNSRVAFSYHNSEYTEYFFAREDVIVDKKKLKQIGFFSKGLHLLSIEIDQIDTSDDFAIAYGWLFGRIYVGPSYFVADNIEWEKYVILVEKVTSFSNHCCVEANYEIKGNLLFNNDVIYGEVEHGLLFEGDYSINVKVIDGIEVRLFLCKFREDDDALYIKTYKRMTYGDIPCYLKIDNGLQSYIESAFI